MKSTRVPGHALVAEGAAHDGQGRCIWRGGYHGGTGRALCSCGELSEVLPSGAARKVWHKTHKAEVPRQPVMGRVDNTEGETE